MTPTNEQKIRECADKIMRDTEAALAAGSRSVLFQEYAEEVESTLTRYFGQTEQPDNSLDEIVEKWYNKFLTANFGEPHFTSVGAMKQACIEYAAQVRQSAAREAAKVVEPWNIHGYSTGSGKDFIYPTEAILAHFNITETKGVKE